MKNTSHFMVILLSFTTYIALLATLSSCAKDNEVFAYAINEEIQENVQEVDGSESEEDSNTNEDNSDPVMDDVVSSDLRAFPGAEGAGANVSGGRGGQVIHVTNLNDSGTGSFREAIQTLGPRIIVFDVSGEINLSSVIYVEGSNYGNFTIAGQTAPEGGITLRGHYLHMYNVQNIIIRYMRFRPYNSANQGSPNDDGIQCSDCRYVIYDHLSVTGGQDENIDFWHFSDATVSGDITVSRTLCGEGSKGMIIGNNEQPSAWEGQTDYSVHHNLFIHSYNRMPTNASGGNYDIVNNLIGNWKWKLISADGNARVNHIANYYKAGTFSNKTQNNGLNLLNLSSNSKGVDFDVQIYTSENIYKGMSWATDSNEDAWTLANDGITQYIDNRTDFFTNSPFDVAGDITFTSANKAMDDVTNDVGANKYLNEDGSFGYWQDDLDTEYINDFLNNSYTNCKGCSDFVWYEGGSYDYPFIPTNTRSESYDTDRDGMADVWEVMNFGSLSFTSSDDNDGDGYTNIEEFINLVDR